ncbi:hypothetical protein DENSPDRAFT_849984 [Dentipellis sp. KUC8613]|nr:hypothetical protein DENSPDRAFT_849984 [Dentipellis sp. KUC8613]
MFEGSLGGVGGSIVGVELGPPYDPRSYGTYLYVWGRVRVVASKQTFFHSVIPVPVVIGTQGRILFGETIIVEGMEVWKRGVAQRWVAEASGWARIHFLAETANEGDRHQFLWVPWCALGDEERASIWVVNVADGTEASSAVVGEEVEPEAAVASGLVGAEGEVGVGQAAVGNGEGGGDEGAVADVSLTAGGSMKVGRRTPQPVLKRALSELVLRISRSRSQDL